MNSMESDEQNGNGIHQAKNPGCLTSSKIGRIIGWVITGLVLACIFALIFGFLVRWLWGMTLSPLFDLPQPSYWQAVGLIILSRLLFGGFGRHKDAHRPAFHSKWRDRMCGYPPEERESA